MIKYPNYHIILTRKKTNYTFHIQNETKIIGKGSVIIYKLWLSQKKTLQNCLNRWYCDMKGQSGREMKKIPACSLKTFITGSHSLGIGGTFPIQENTSVPRMRAWVFA